jgi:hypothetical protein
VITDLANGRVPGQQASIPTPSCIRPRRIQGDRGAAKPAAALAPPDTGASRGAARNALHAALTGVRLGGRERQFLSKLVHWDKRNAASVAALLSGARQAGRDEAGLTPRQLETILAALSDATVYRAMGDSAGRCWDCANIPGGRCAEHLKDADRARAYAELAAALSARASRHAGPGLAASPDELGGYRRRTSVAS